ncbi:MAG: heme-binding domain-containing protein [Bacteroidaceae bacterium]|nr:heme-binding domain-containing protein [Bacteroidaceae bacterium]
MKKKLIIGALVLVVALFFIYRISVKAPSGIDYSDRAKVASIFIKGDCLTCHSANATLPFYANVPVVGDMVKADVAEGYRMFDMQPFMDALLADQPLKPVDVAKVEKVAEDGTMPPMKYYALHWGSQITDEKADIVEDWARDYRTQYYADGLTDDRAGEPIRPIPLTHNADARKAELGRILYHDVRLSVDNTVSCASCHGLNTAGVDNKQYSEGVQGQLGGVNAPTVYNAVYNFVQFWDGRAATLADQAAGPPLNPIEMASTSFDEIIAKLAADKELTRAFAEVYPEGWSQATITDAIEQFEMTLITPNSRFDQYLRGNEDAITDAEEDGYELFKKYNCATCHVGVNLGGESYELMGMYKPYFVDRGWELTVEDNGRFKETQDERDRHRFKVPSLRNVALTWPYYHDGSQTSLKEAVCKMGTYQSGVELTDPEEDLIVAFLNTLTGEYEGKTLTNDNVQPQ